MASNRAIFHKHDNTQNGPHPEELAAANLPSGLSELPLDQIQLDGIQIIETTLVTAGTYLIGVFNFATLYDKGSIRIEMGLDGNDYTKNLRTILAEYRGAMVVKNNDRTAFVTGTFATDQAALETA